MPLHEPTESSQKKDVLTTDPWLSMKFRFSKFVCITVLFCVAVAIASPAQTLTTLYTFLCSQQNCPDGQFPYAGLVQGTDGNFYGTTTEGGATANGTVFKITPGGDFSLLYSFCPEGLPCTDGQTPYAGLVQGTDGNFYGTTYYGGAYKQGAIFKITPSGTLTTLYSFCAGGFPCADGANPNAGLVQGTDGYFYGVTYDGGTSGGNCGIAGCGTFFKIDAEGVLTTLHLFNGADGSGLMSTLIQANDGNFYGTAPAGGAYGQGTVFKVTPSGTPTTLYSFCSLAQCADGADPEAGLVQATDGNFYGTTRVGGTGSSHGTVFKITPDGTLTTLHSFSVIDGDGPVAGLTQATDGNLYGTTYGGGPTEGGTIFKITPQPPFTLTTLYSFCSQSGCADGERPRATLLEATDGNFYGTTEYGTIFRLSLPNFQIGTASGGSYSATVSAGSNAVYDLDVTGTNGFTGAVSFSCSGLPPGATCSANPAQAEVTTSNPTVPFTLTITTTSSMAAVGFGLPWSGAPFASFVSGAGRGLGRAAALFGLGLFFMILIVPRRRLTLATMLLCAAGLVSCGGGNTTPSPPPTPQTYTVVLTATSGNIVHTQNLTLIVQ